MAVGIDSSPSVPSDATLVSKETLLEVGYTTTKAEAMWDEWVRHWN